MRLVLISLALVSLSAHAEVIPGFTYAKQVKAKDARGEINLNYVLLSPRAVPNDRVRRPVNAIIANTAREQLCEADRDNSAHMYANLSTTVTYANQLVLSFRQSYDSYCMGAYPNHGTQSKIFNLRTGKELSLDSEARDVTALKALLGAKILANAPAKDPADGEEGCHQFYDLEQLSNASLEVGLKGDKLVVTQDYAHAAKACEFDTEVSLSEVKPLLKASSVLQRIVK